MSFTWNGATSDQMGLNVTSRVVYTGPAYSLETVSVPGRSGDILIPNNRYNNKKVTYTGYMRSTGCVGDTPYERLSNGLILLRAWLLQNPGVYLDLEDTYDPGYTRKAFIDGEIGIKEVQDQAFGATVQITFNVQPFMYGPQVPDIVLSRDTGTSWKELEIINPNSFASSPRIVFDMTSTGYFRITDANGTVTSWTIDTVLGGDVIYDNMDWFDESNLLDASVSNSAIFPTLEPGSNKIGILAGVRTVTVTPRWRTL